MRILWNRSVLSVHKKPAVTGSLKRAAASLLVAAVFLATGCSKGGQKEEVVRPEKEEVVYKSPLTNKLIKHGTIFKKIVKEEYTELLPSLTETRIAYQSYAGEMVQLFLIEADLSDKQLQVKPLLPGGKETLTGAAQTVSKMAQAADKLQHEVLLAFNGDFFEYKDGGYWPLGIVVQDSRPVKTRYSATSSFFGITGEGKPIIGGVDRFGQDKGVTLNVLSQALGGYHWLVNDFTGVKSEDDTKHPRTAIGYGGTKVYFLVVDGRAPGYSAGVTLNDMAALFEGLKEVRYAINLDGGGSATYVAKKQGEWKIINRPSDGGERAVANGIGIINLGKPIN